METEKMIHAVIFLFIFQIHKAIKAFTKQLNGS